MVTVPDETIFGPLWGMHTIHYTVYRLPGAEPNHSSAILERFPQGWNETSLKGQEIEGGRANLQARRLRKHGSHIVADLAYPAVTSWSRIHCLMRLRQ